MQMKRYAQAVILLLSIVLPANPSAASQDREVTLEPVPGNENARGGLIIRDKAPLTCDEPMKEITINATGLAPNSVYTVWTVSEEPRAKARGLGDADYSFKSDAAGNGSYTAVIPDQEWMRCRRLEIMRHPDGNPGNLKDREMAFKADLR